MSVWIGINYIQFFDKNTRQKETGINDNQELANELHNPITIEFPRRKLFSSC